MLKTMRFTLFRCCIAVLSVAGLSGLASLSASAQEPGGGWYCQRYCN